MLEKFQTRIFLVTLGIYFLIQLEAKLALIGNYTNEVFVQFRIKRKFTETFYPLPILSKFSSDPSITIVSFKIKAYWRIFPTRCPS